MSNEYSRLGYAEASGLLATALEMILTDNEPLPNDAIAAIIYKNGMPIESKPGSLVRLLDKIKEKYNL